MNILKEQIEATIQAYELACKPENLNYEYCFENILHRGICFFAIKNDFMELQNIIKCNVIGWLVEAPYMFDDHTSEDIKEVHETRIRYLKKLLKRNKNIQKNK